MLKVSAHQIVAFLSKLSHAQRIKLALAILKLAHRPRLHKLGLTPQKIRDGEAFMVYRIDPSANASKFYEGLILPSHDGWILHRVWGRLADEGTGRADGKKDEFHASIESAKKSLIDHYRKRISHKYVDAFGPKHVDPATGKKLKLGEYPVGLGPAAFGWGGQKVQRHTEDLRRLQAVIHSAVSEDRAVDALEELQGVERILQGISDSSMASKLLGYFKGAKRYLSQGDLDKGKKALKTISNYIVKQIALAK